MAKRPIKWYKPRGHTGWEKGLPASTRRARLLAATNKGYNKRTRYRKAGRKALALANVTQDRPTAKKAKGDANYFFRKLRKER